MIKLNRLKSLIWLRWQYLMSNKGLLYIGIGMPIGEMALLSLIPNIHGNAGFLSFSLNFVYSITSGSFISLMIGEEKEKKNLRTLILSGVKMKEYTFSVIIFPFIFSIISCIYFPLLFGVHISSWPVYIFIIVSECLFFILANLSIGLFSFCLFKDTEKLTLGACPQRPGNHPFDLMLFRVENSSLGKPS